MTAKRMAFLQRLLDFVGLGGRLHLTWISSAEAQKFVDVVTDFTEAIRRLGPSPLIGFSPKAMSLRPRAVPTESRQAGPMNPAAAVLTNPAAR
jgi:F420-non-reducing hydrogenase iron-sulfur subunit